MNRTAPRRRVRALAVGLAIAVGLGGCGDDGATPATTPPATTPPAATTERTTTDAVEVLRAEVVATRVHDAATFTQGLELDGDTLYESSGLYGASVVQARDRTTGAVLRTHTFPSTVFAEGLTRVGDRLIVLTWRERTAYVLDAATFQVVTTLGYDGEGWGVCSLGDQVVTSDGSSTLTLRDPGTFAVRGTRTVRLDGAEVRDLNELECVDGAVYANVWKTDRIVRIDLADGRVRAVIDTPGLRPPSTLGDADAVLNGIAYDASTGRFLITGKRWPTAYDVRFTRAS